MIYVRLKALLLIKMSRYRSDPEMYDVEGPSTCAKILRYTWKTITCIFSHITLVTMVVSYCILGAYTFARLEGQHEIDVRFINSIHNLLLKFYIDIRLKRILVKLEQE